MVRHDTEEPTVINVVTDRVNGRIVSEKYPKVPFTQILFSESVLEETQPKTLKEIKIFDKSNRKLINIYWVQLKMACVWMVKILYIIK